jgi:hypothetical protein
MTIGPRNYIMDSYPVIAFVRSNLRDIEFVQTSLSKDMGKRFNNLIITLIFSVKNLWIAWLVSPIIFNFITIYFTF